MAIFSVHRQDHSLKYFVAQCSTSEVGSHMGGARPKAVVEDDNALWIAKFNRPDDKWNTARIEHAMLVLARACGINTAESRVMEIAGRDVLLVKRFDREKTAQGYLRARMLSALKHVNDAADDAPVIFALLAAHVSRQVRLHFLPLIVGQPEQVFSHL